MGKLQESSENYLETILILSLKHENVRSIDIAKYLGFSKPSISVALKHLKEQDLISINEKNHISLTISGLNIAENTYKRHLGIKKLFMIIGINEQTAESDACKIEHIICEETFQKIIAFIKNK